MSWASWLVWGFAATALLTTLMAGSEGLGVTRMNIPHMLGTMFTANRDRAKVYGAIFHFLNGWAFSIVYIAGFHSAHIFTWWFGAVLGILHGAFVAAVVLPVLPGVHPRMASELRGPTVARQLEPPGFLALNYGVRTPISILIAHIAFGAMLGGFYSPSSGASRSPSVSDRLSKPATGALSVPHPGVHWPRTFSGRGPCPSAAPMDTAKSIRQAPPPWHSDSTLGWGSRPTRSVAPARSLNTRFSEIGASYARPSRSGPGVTMAAQCIVTSRSSPSWLSSVRLARVHVTL
jgi:hypothetical protein